MTKQTLITESTEYLAVNIEDRTVKQVIIKQGISLNNRLWSKEVLQAAAPKFEGAKTFSDHGGWFDLPERSVLDITGWLEDVKYDDDLNAIVGTRHFSDTAKGQDVYKLIASVVEKRAPKDLVGASIHVLGSGEEDEDGVMVIEQIFDVISVDDVTFPAAGGNFSDLAASANERGLVAAVMEKATYEEWLASRQDFARRLKGEMKKERQTLALQDRDRKIKELEDRAELYRYNMEVARTDASQMADKLAQKDKELELSKVLSRAKLPASWKESIRDSLLDSSPDEWGELIDAEISKVSLVRGNSRVNETRQRVMPPIEITDSGLPLEHEDYNEYMRRMGATRQGGS